MTDPTPFRRGTGCPTNHARVVELAPPYVARGAPRHDNIRTGKARPTWVIVVPCYCKDCHRHVERRSEPIVLGAPQEIPAERFGQGERRVV